MQVLTLDEVMKFINFDNLDDYEHALTDVLNRILQYDYQYFSKLYWYEEAARQCSILKNGELSEEEQLYAITSVTPYANEGVIMSEESKGGREAPLAI